MAKQDQTSRKRQPSAIQNTTGKQLVIVESPAKARTINKYLGPDYVVMASVGHVRDLPSKNPKGIKDPIPGVDLEHDFKPTYQIIKGKGTTVNELKQAAKKANGVWLATDLDREGEAIAWHLAEALGIQTKDSKRVVFNAITKSEIEKAFRNPKHINIDKVNAQQARRILDRIVGYQVSPLLWKKVAGGLSAGRVQSVAVRILVEREREIEAFVPEEYWKLIGYFTASIKETGPLREQWEEWLAQGAENGSSKKTNGRTIREKNAWLAEHNGLIAELIEVDGKRFSAKTVHEALKTAKWTGFRLEEQTKVDNPKAKGPAQMMIYLKGHLENGPAWHVRSIQTKRTKNRPNAPFITSTLQQAAATQLGFTAQNTMKIAQTLYEGVQIQDMGFVGLITYMRTDSTHLSRDAIEMAREYIQKEFGNQYLPATPIYYTSSNKSAQEAHEAIRPTDIHISPDQVESSLPPQQYKLYKIIWERFVACQMKEAEWDSTTLLVSGKTDSNELTFRATGRTLVFDGQYKVIGVPNNSEEATLPVLRENQPLAALQIDPVQNFTSPPPRYTEASLVKKLESEGIGRPSTYAQIIQVIQNRKYAEKIQNRFYATDLGKVVTDKLIEAFQEIMQVGYTRDMEQVLDDIEENHADWIQMLHQFYRPFKQNLDAAYQGMEHAKAETQPAPHKCPQCGNGTVYRFGRNGRFLSCSKYPDCKYAAPIDRDGNPTHPEETDVACPKCGHPLLLKQGRFGPFLSCKKYPDCDGIVNLDKKGFVTPPKVPPLNTDLKCPKCEAPLNLRRGARGPWLSCSKFPKCRGRLGWNTLDDKVKKTWEHALDLHEKANPQPVIRKVDGSPLGESYKPRTLEINNDTNGTEFDENGI
ncbi:MAG: type I DNA topoisomerase [Deltaproteobacteria bacterium]|nr:type I DNA topoisomerase [Deltaproteobacteria bacterium]